MPGMFANTFIFTLNYILSNNIPHSSRGIIQEQHSPRRLEMQLALGNE